MAEEPLHLIIAGAPKAGTTSIFEYLKSHPEVGASFEKNTHHFTDPDFDFDGREMAIDRAERRGVTSYRDHFPPEHRDVLVEATATYFTSLGTPRRIRDELDRVKLIFMVREPAERFASAWRVHLEGNYVDPRTTLGDYYEMQYRNLDQMRLSITRQALLTGHYSSILEGWYDVFDRDDVLVLPFTGLREPRSLMSTVCAFAGIDDGYYDHHDFDRFNASHTIRNPGFHNRVRSLRSKLIRSQVMQTPAVRKPLEFVIEKAVRPAYGRAMFGDTTESPDDEVMAALRKEYEGEAEALARLTGREGLLD